MVKKKQNKTQTFIGCPDFFTTVYDPLCETQTTVLTLCLKGWYYCRHPARTFWIRSYWTLADFCLYVLLLTGWLEDRVGLLGDVSKPNPDDCHQPRVTAHVLFPLQEEPHQRTDGFPEKRLPSALLLHQLSYHISSHCQTLQGLPKLFKVSSERNSVSFLNLSNCYWICISYWSHFFPFSGWYSDLRMSFCLRMQKGSWRNSAARTVWPPST